VEAVGPDRYGMQLRLPENGFRFLRHIESRRPGRPAGAG
jgi:hypothetical protein